MFDQQNFGMSMPDALRGMALRVPVLDARFFVTAVLTQRESGGNLAEILDNLSSVMRERFKVKRQIRVISAHGRLSGWILSLVPPGLAAVLFLLQPNYMRILVDDPVGIRLVLAALALQATGMYIISRLVQDRVLAMDLPINTTFVLLFVSLAAATSTLLWLVTEPRTTKRRLSQVWAGRCRRPSGPRVRARRRAERVREAGPVVRAQVAQGR